MAGHPTIRQQSLQGSRVARVDCCNPTQHAGQARPRINAVPPRALNQRVERRRCLPAILASPHGHSGRRPSRRLKRILPRHEVSSPQCSGRPCSDRVGRKATAARLAACQKLQGTACDAAPQTVSDEADRRAGRHARQCSRKIVTLGIAVRDFELHVGPDAEHNSVGWQRPNNQAEGTTGGDLPHARVERPALPHGAIGTGCIAVNENGGRD